MNEVFFAVRAQPHYAEQMEDLMHTAYGTTREAPEDVFTAAMFRHHMAIFPEGQFVALDGDRVVGLTASMRVSFDSAAPELRSWWSMVGDGWLRHESDGAWMYGVESNVHPDYRGQGVGSVLMDARFDTARDLNLRGMVAGSAIVDYHTVAAHVPVAEYVRGVTEGRYFDTNLSKQIAKGFRPGALIPDYLKGDADSLGWGVLIVWDNPGHDATRPFGTSVPERRYPIVRRAPKTVQRSGAESR